MTEARKPKRPDSPLEKAALAVEKAYRNRVILMNVGKTCDCPACKIGRGFFKACAAHRAKRK